MSNLNDKNYIYLKRLGSQDAEKLSDLLLQSNPDYAFFFHPFNFEVSSIRQILEKNIKDVFFGIQLQKAQADMLIGFYMLRGLDEGYLEPMYGVFIAQEYSGKGIAHFTLAHAECFCRINRYSRLLLKVHPQNNRARHLYESLGFQLLSHDPFNQNFILYKDLWRSAGC